MFVPRRRPLFPAPTAPTAPLPGSYARSKFAQWCALDRSSPAARAASYAAFLALVVVVPAAVSTFLRVDASLYPSSHGHFNRVATLTASGLAAVFFHQCGGLGQVLFLDRGAQALDGWVFLAAARRAVGRLQAAGTGWGAGSEEEGGGDAAGAAVSAAGVALVRVEETGTGAAGGREVGAGAEASMRADERQ